MMHLRYEPKSILTPKVSTLSARALDCSDGGVQGGLGSGQGLAGLLGALDADGVVQVIHLCICGLT